LLVKVEGLLTHAKLADELGLVILLLSGLALDDLFVSLAPLLVFLVGFSRGFIFLFVLVVLILFFLQLSVSLVRIRWAEDRLGGVFIVT